MLGLLLAALVVVGVEAALAQDYRHGLAAPVDLTEPAPLIGPDAQGEKGIGAQHPPPAEPRELTVTTRLGLTGQDVQQTTMRSHAHVHDDLRRSKRVIEKATGRLLKPPPRTTGRQQPISDRPDSEHEAGGTGAHAADPALQADQQTITHQPREHPLTRPRRRRLTVMLRGRKVDGLDLTGAHQPQIGDLPDYAQVPL